MPRTRRSARNRHDSGNFEETSQQQPNDSANMAVANVNKTKNSKTQIQKKRSTSRSKPVQSELKRARRSADEQIIGNNHSQVQSADNFHETSFVEDGRMV